MTWADSTNQPTLHTLLVPMILRLGQSMEPRMYPPAIEGLEAWAPMTEGG
jgi:hypothetical protein